MFLNYFFYLLPRKIYFLKSLKEKNMDVAIVGLSFRLPSGLQTENELWDIFISGSSAIRKVPEERWPIHTLEHPNRAELGRSVTFSAGILPDLDKFDASFFGISPREASYMDPQQRLLLTLAYEALENAHIPSQEIQASNTGVYIGMSSLDYGMANIEDLSTISSHTMTGNTMSIAANRISYYFDLHGPSLSIDTACSSSLVALHYACNALRAGEIPMALVGGVNVLMHPYSFIGFSKASMISATGQSLPFDARANGYVRSEGSVVLVLKKLESALANNDIIHGIIRSSGVNTDGKRKTGITIPSIDGQVELMSHVLSASGLTAKDIDFVEMHGTGTPVGDPIETQSVASVYAKRDAVLPISSAKTNFGHLEPASGLLGLVKALLTCKYKVVPPAPQNYEPNPNIDFDGLNIHYSTKPYILQEKSSLFTAVNSFGFGGVNAHVVLEYKEEYAKLKQTKTRTKALPTTEEHIQHDVLSPLFLSAKSKQSLLGMATTYAKILSNSSIEEANNIAYTTAYYRNLFEKRLAVFANTPQDMALQLQSFADNTAQECIVEEFPLKEDSNTAFVYSGNGAQWFGMGKVLLEQSPEFTDHMKKLDEYMCASLSFSLIDKILHAKEEDLAETSIAQPLLFAIQVALTLMLKKQSVTPHVVIGHSVGEVVAAWACDALSLEQAIRVIIARSQCQSLTVGTGRMAAIKMRLENMQELLSQLSLQEKIFIAGVNAPTHLTLAGDYSHLQTLQKYCSKYKIYFKLLDLNYAFHSPFMDSIKDTLLEKLKDLKPNKEQKAIFISTVTGNEIESQNLNAEYWWLNVRNTVLFAPALQIALEKGCRIFVEISPNAILQRYIKDIVNENKQTCCVLPTLLREKENAHCITKAALRIKLAQPTPDLSFYFPHALQQVALPNYSWQQESHWFQYTNERVWEKRRIHPLLGWELDSIDLSFENILDPATLPWLLDHKVGEACVFPAAGYVEIALAVAKRWLGNKGALHSLDIIAPLVFDNSIPQTIRVTLDTHDGKIKIFARPRFAESTWMLYAIGRLIEQDFHQAQSQYLTKIQQIEDKITFAKREVYELALGLGLEYGPVFQRINILHMMQNTIEAQIEIQDLDITSYSLPPAILDSCFHSLVVLLAKSTDTTPTAYLPIKVGMVQVYGDIQEVSCIRVTILRYGKRSLLANCFMLDKQNIIIAETRECRFAKAQLNRHKQVKTGIYETVARLKELPRDKAISMKQPMLLLQELQTVFTKDKKERTKWFTETLPLLEAFTLSSAVYTCAELQKQHTNALQNLQESAYGIWIIDLLMQENLLTYENNAYCFHTTNIPTPEELAQTLNQQASESLLQSLQISRIATHLAAQSKYLENITQSPVATSLAQNDPTFTGILQSIEKLLQNIGLSLSQEQCLNILQIGTKYGDVVYALSTILPEECFNLTLACENDEILHQTTLRFAAHKNINCVALDLKNFQIHDECVKKQQFDIVIVHHTLHNVKDINHAINTLNEYLLPNALLFVAERHPDWYANFIHGVQDAWWRSDGKTPLFAPSTWQQLLKEKNFIDCVLYTEPESQNLAEGAYLLIAQKSASTLEQIPNMQGAEWLLLGDDSSYTPLIDLAKELKQAGHNVCIDCDLKSQSLIKTYPENVVYMKGVQEEIYAAVTLLEDLRSHAVQMAQNKNARLWIITQGGSLCSVEKITAQTPHPLQASLWGMGRVIMNELPELQCKLLDMHSTDISLLRTEMLKADLTDEVLITEKGRYALELLKYKKFKQNQNQDRYRLDISQQGKISNLRWLNDTEKELKADDIEVKVMASGLNFRDVMFALGILTEEVIENGFAGASLGLEFSGIVSRIGSDVDTLKVGDVVVGFAPSSFASHVVTKAYAVAPLFNEQYQNDTAWNFETAASIPTIFFTAYYAIKHLAQMQVGESLLIHGAAGGVGLAAIQIAKHLGLNIYATAGSDEKRDLLRLYGVEHIYDSRTLNFAEEILTDTGGEGVDAVINSLAGEAMRRSIDLLKPFGRFLELGKRDFVENTSIGLKPFKENISYFAIDADQILVAKPKLATAIFQELMHLFHKNIFTPLPVRTFKPDNIREAFVCMQQSQHIGKLVVSIHQKPSHIISTTTVANNITSKAHILDTSGTWLVTGGLDGFGLATAQWLVEQGVKELVLASRQGIKAPKAQQIIQDFNAKGITIKAMTCDVTRAEQVQELIQSIQTQCSPLVGLVHAATVYDDAFIADMDTKSLEKVIAPKFIGAWHLHEATLNLPLKHFILYSSISVVLGNPGQANYVAANAGQEGLTLLRKSLGLPALCIEWGPVGDVGYLVTRDAVKKSLEQHLGASVLNSSSALNTLQGITHDTTLALIANVDFGTVQQSLPYKATRFNTLFADAKHTPNEGALQDYASLLVGKSTEEATHIICTILIEEIADVLSYDVKQIEKGQVLQSLGLDSLMAVELSVGLEQRFGIRLPTMLLQDSPTVEKVAQRIVKRLLEQKVSDSEEERILALAQTHGETLSEHDINNMKSEIM